MSELLIFVFAMVISMAIVPMMIKLAPRVGMVDMPDPRKVHSIPIPRVGGIGIVVGALIPVAALLPYDPLLFSYLFGSLVLLVFGVWDDSCELGHYVKFIGQFAAVLPVVYYADIYVSVLPMYGEIPEVAGKIFTVIAIVGVINAINHSDGLDGLAGGMSILSLACIGYLMYLAGDMQMVMLAVSVMGGVFGFLKFNSHPARVFMGDGGSQFLGFTLGFLAVVLTQKSNTALSPALPALFLGLPVIDILAVFYLRASSGMNWFRASRNHIHHRLLDIGFTHYESVIIIYLVQMFLISSSIILMYDYDYIILLVYLLVVVSVFSFLTIAEHSGFKVNKEGKVSRIDEFINTRLKSKKLLMYLGYYLAVSIPALFFIITLSAETVTEDVATMAMFLIITAVVLAFFAKKVIGIYLKLVMYVAAALVVYLDYSMLENASQLINKSEIVYYSIMALAMAIIIKFDKNINFDLSPMDYLVAIIVIVSFFVFNFSPISSESIGGYSILKLILLFYGCELIEKRSAKAFRYASIATLCVLLVLSIQFYI